MSSELNSSLKINIHPMVLMQIGQFQYRKQFEANTKVVGTLLGHVYSTHIEISNCFAIPTDSQDKDSQVKVSEEMLYVYNNEVVIGAFVTPSKAIQKDIAKLTRVYMFKNAAFNAQRNLKNPLIVQIDPTFQNGTLDMKAYVLEDSLESMNTMIGQLVFRQYPVNVEYRDEQLNELVPFTYTDIGEQKDYDLLKLNNINQMIENIIMNLKVIKEKVDRIIAGQEESDEVLGEQLKNVLNLQPLCSQKQLTELQDQYENDTILLQFLTNLAKTQSIVAEKLNLVKKK